MELKILEQKELLGKAINVYGTPENPLFLAKEVAEWIEHSNTAEMIRNVDDDEKLISTILISGQNRDVWMLTENGLYEVLFQSRKPNAKDFKKGVKKILKQIRQTGGYVPAALDDTPEMIMARGLEVAMSTIERMKSEKQKLQVANAKLQNRSDVYDLVFGSEKYLSGSQVCKILELGYGNITLYKHLREMGIFFKNRNEPMQQYANKKYILLKEKWIDGKNQPVLTPYFSQSFIPQLAIKLGAIRNNLDKINIQ